MLQHKKQCLMKETGVSISLVPYGGAHNDSRRNYGGDGSLILIYLCTIAK